MRLQVHAVVVYEAEAELDLEGKMCVLLIRQMPESKLTPKQTCKSPLMKGSCRNCTGSNV